MNEQSNAKQPSKRTRAAMQASEARRRRMAAVRARETVIENTVIDVIAAKLAITEAEYVLVGGVARLKELGETQDSIAELCQMSAVEVKAAVAAANTDASESRAVRRARGRDERRQIKEGSDV